MPMSRPRAIQTALFLTCLFSPLHAAAQQTPPPPAVIVAPVTSQNLGLEQTFTGRVTAQQKVELRARVPGFVEERAFTEGAKVKQGDLLYRLERGAYEAAITQINGQIASAESEKKLADIEVQRQQTLLEKQTVAQSVVDRVVAERGKVEGKLLELQGTLQDAELELSYTEISAPFDGRIGLSSVDLGDFVDGASAPLATVTSIDPIYVVVPVAESVLLDYRSARAKGTLAEPPSATIRLANDEVYASKGKAEFVDVQVSETTDTVTVRFVFENADGLLLDGQLVNVQLETPTSEASLTVPSKAIARDQTGDFVLVVGDDSTVEKRGITVARRAGAVAVVTGGVEEGEMVITEGLNKVRPGGQVDAAEADTPDLAPSQSVDGGPTAASPDAPQTE